MARRTLEAVPRSQPSLKPIAQILRCPQAGYSLASLSTKGSMQSTTGAGHGPLTWSPRRCLASRQQ